MTPPFTPLQGAPNFRDVGGYLNTEGARVRHGRVFRSEGLTRLTDADLAAVAGLNISLLYDLRGHEERQREPNRWPDRPLETVVVNLDSHDLDAVRLSGWRERIPDPSFDVPGVRQWITHAYGKMPQLFAGTLASLFDRLTEPTSPVALFHCTAGKDRTGFVGAMLLSALNASRDTVFEDYLLTGKLRPASGLLQTLLGEQLEQLPADKIAALTVMAEVNPDYLNNALHSIERDFGNIDKYLRTACGLDAHKRDQLHAQLLE